MNYYKKTTLKTILSISLIIILMNSCSEDEPKIPSVNEIMIKTPPTKTLYKSGEVLDLSGLVVTINYDNEETMDVEFSDFEKNGITNSPENGIEISEAIFMEITHVESGLSTGQEISINEVAEVSIKTLPTLLNYLLGETLDYSGLEITLTRDDGETEDVSLSEFANYGLVISPEEGSEIIENLTSFTVTHNRSGKNVTQTIIINSVSSISVNTPPSKIEYYTGEVLDISGLSVTLNLDNGSTRELALSDFDSYDVVTSPLDGDEITNEDTELIVTHEESGQTISQSLTLLVLTDIEGNTYAHIRIGEQIWMAENLKTSKFSNGDNLGTTSSPTLDISDENNPLYQWAYNGDESNVDIYGRLYTKYVTNDSRGICPSGWHVPNVEEFSELQNYLITEGFKYDNTTSGNKIGKAIASTTYWQTIDWAEGVPGNNPSSNNSSGFNGLPSGARVNFDVYFLGQTSYTYWWSTDSDADDNGNAFRIQSFQQEADIVTIGDVNTGAPIRCLLD